MKTRTETGIQVGILGGNALYMGLNTIDSDIESIGSLADSID